MIRIKKGKEPDILKGKGRELTEELVQYYQENKDEILAGEKKFEFDSKVYRHKTVKEALKNAQFEKCCFCERKVEIGDVEHFRPKAGVQQEKGDSLEPIAYYWLAYDWENLFLACPKCNRSFKKNLFPLENPVERAESTDGLENEKLLIVHPSKDDPENEITFFREVPKQKNGSLKGKTTINTLGLDRAFLNARRENLYVLLKKLYRLHSTFVDPEKAEYEEMIAEYMQDDAEYASMVRCAVRNNFRF